MKIFALSRIVSVFPTTQNLTCLRPLENYLFQVKFHRYEIRTYAMSKNRPNVWNERFVNKNKKEIRFKLFLKSCYNDNILALFSPICHHRHRFRSYKGVKFNLLVNIDKYKNRSSGFGDMVNIMILYREGYADSFRIR